MVIAVLIVGLVCVAVASSWITVVYRVRLHARGTAEERPHVS